MARFDRRLRRVVGSAASAFLFRGGFERSTWPGIFYVLALFFNSPHSMATGYRAYHRTCGRVLDQAGFSPKLAYAGTVKAGGSQVRDESCGSDRD